MNHFHLIFSDDYKKNSGEVTGIVPTHCDLYSGDCNLRVYCVVFGGGLR